MKNETRSSVISTEVSGNTVATNGMEKSNTRKTFRQTLSFLLAISMIISLAPSTIYAENGGGGKVA